MTCWGALTFGIGIGACLGIAAMLILAWILGWRAE